VTRVFPIRITPSSFACRGAGSATIANFIIILNYTIPPL